jgi:hypothetical protein
MSSGAMIYIPSFQKTGSGIQKLIGGYTDTQQGDLLSLFSFFQNKESELKNEAFQKKCFHISNKKFWEELIAYLP